MDEEELEQPKNKITLSSFFESIASVEKVANNALSIANSNLNIIQEQRSLIDALSLSIEGLKSDIQEVNNYITIEKNEASDKLVETQDDKQKQMISMIRDRETSIGLMISLILTPGSISGMQL